MPSRIFAFSIAVTAVLMNPSIVFASQAISRGNNDLGVVSIAITVGPIAEIRFPEGLSFELRVGESDVNAAEHGDDIAGLETLTPESIFRADVPFLVLGNAYAVVEARPSRVAYSGAREVGVAAKSSGPVGREGVLGYTLEIDFEGNSRNRNNSRTQERVRAEFATATAISSVDVAQSERMGLLRIYADATLFESNTGIYHGEVIMAISAEQ